MPLIWYFNIVKKIISFLCDCSYFQPCSGCLDGVLDVLPIAGAYCLDDLYYKCLKWIAKHFVIVLPTRNFSALPPEVQDRCLKQIMDDMVSFIFRLTQSRTK